MTISRRCLLLSTLIAAAFPAVRRAAAAPFSPEYWPTQQWQVALPADQGVDVGALADADRLIRTSMPDVSGLLVVRNGYIVHEAYFGGEFGRADPVRIFSITKSVVSLLIGAALTDGSLAGLDGTLGDHIPERIPESGDPKSSTISIENLLTMTAGFDWDEDVDFPALTASDNWLEFTLTRPIVSEPGAEFNYNSGSSHVLSAVIENATGEDVADYAQRVLFTPLGIARPVWERAPEGLPCGGFGLELSARNLAKIGLLMLSEGRWDSDRIVRSDYIRAATEEQSAGGAPGYGGYGYLWWVTEPQGLPAFFAMGFGEQYLYVFPERQMVVVVVKGYSTEPALFTPPRPMIETMILPAVEEGTPVG